MSQDGDSGDYARQLASAARAALATGGHGDCPYLSSAQYMPEAGIVVCGCGYHEQMKPTIGPDRVNGEAMLAGHRPPVATDPIRSSLALIDPTEVYGPEQVERHILDTLYRLETGALFERQCIERAAAAESAFNRAFHACVHASQQTSELKRKAEAEVHCDREGLTAERDEAQMILRAIKATMHNLRAVLSGYQSTARSVTAAYQGGGSAGRF